MSESTPPADDHDRPEEDQDVNPVRDADYEPEGSTWVARSATGEAAFVEPAAERTDEARPFSSSADSPLDSDPTQH
jgi:hypothetical protein